LRRVVKGQAGSHVHWGTELADRTLSGWNVPPENGCPEKLVLFGDVKVLKQNRMHSEHGIKVGVVGIYFVMFPDTFQLSICPKIFRIWSGSNKKVRRIYTFLIAPKPPLKDMPKNYRYL
jgi:hypothetical protein